MVAALSIIGMWIDFASHYGIRLVLYRARHTPCSVSRCLCVHRPIRSRLRHSNVCLLSMGEAFSFSSWSLPSQVSSQVSSCGFRAKPVSFLFAGGMPARRSVIHHFFPHLLCLTWSHLCLHCDVSCSSLLLRPGGKEAARLRVCLHGRPAGRQVMVNENVSSLLCCSS